MSGIDLCKAELLLLDIINDLYAIGYFLRMMKAKPESEGCRRNFWEGCEFVSNESKSLRQLVLNSDWTPTAFLGQTSCVLTMEHAHRCTIAIAKFRGLNKKIPLLPSQLEDIQLTLIPHGHIDVDALKRGVTSEMTEARRQELLLRNASIVGVQDPSKITSASTPNVGAMKRRTVRKSVAAKTDRERWEFAKPLRECRDQVTWKKIATMWQEHSGEPCDETAMKQSCYRVRKAERNGT